MSDDPLKKLSPKKRIYVKERAKGKSKKEAGLKAGFSESTAENAKSHIETPEVMEAFEQIMRQAVPASKIATRIAEGIDAMETVFAKFEGRITDSKDVVAWSERRAYAELAAQYGGHYTPKKAIEHKGEGGGPICFQLERIG